MPTNHKLWFFCFVHHWQGCSGSKASSSWSLIKEGWGFSRESPENSSKNDQRLLNIQKYWRNLSYVLQKKNCYTRGDMRTIQIHAEQLWRVNMQFSVSSKDKGRGCKLNSQQRGFQSIIRENFLKGTTVKPWSKLVWKTVKFLSVFLRRGLTCSFWWYISCNRLKRWSKRVFKSIGRLWYNLTKQEPYKGNGAEQQGPPSLYHCRNGNLISILTLYQPKFSGSSGYTFSSKQAHQRDF